MKSMTQVGGVTRRAAQREATLRTSQVLVQAEGAGIGTEYGNLLIQQAISLARRERIPVSDPFNEIRSILTDALSRYPQHDEGCVAWRSAQHNGYLPASHPCWKLQPPCTCWVGRLAEWLKTNSEI